MIANEKQYRTTKKLHKEFMEQVAILQQNQASDLLNAIHINSLQAKIDDFELEGYDPHPHIKGVVAV